MGARGVPSPPRLPWLLCLACPWYHAPDRLLPPHEPVLVLSPGTACTACRYGDPKLCSEKEDVAFAQRFQKECSLTFLQAALAQLAVLAQVGAS